jgi:hypothetical protein
MCVNALHTLQRQNSKWRIVNDSTLSLAPVIFQRRLPTRIHLDIPIALDLRHEETYATAVMFEL